MKKYLLLPLAIGLLLISGCVYPSRTARTGNFVETAASANTAIADDAGNVIAKAYPPAGTQLNMTATGEFGKALAAKLRSMGFGVEELTKSTTPASPGLALSYVLDTLPQDNLMRLTLHVDQASFSRVYNTFDMAPAGQWTRKE